MVWVVFMYCGGCVPIALLVVIVLFLWLMLVIRSISFVSFILSMSFALQLCVLLVWMVGLFGGVCFVGWSVVGRVSVL